MNFNLNALVQWLAIGQQVFSGGTALWTDIKAVLANHGVSADTAALDAVIADATTREARAEADAAGTQ